VEKVERREGLICVCAECKKVIRTVGEGVDPERARVSHGICHECAMRLYGDLFPREKTETKDA
jgi:hypothetical protein